VRILGRTAKLSLLGVWLVALLFTIFFATKQFMYKAFDASVIESKVLTDMAIDTMYIKMVDDSKLNENSSLRRRYGKALPVVKNGKDMVYSNDIRVNIFPSDTDKVLIKVRKKSKGKSLQHARENASEIIYEYELDADRFLLDGYFLSDLENRYLEQRIYVDIYLPSGLVVYLDKSTQTFLYDVSNIDDLYDSDMPKHYFEMTDSGLKCLDCTNEFNSEDTGKTSNSSESLSLKIDEKGVRIEVVDDDNERAKVKIDRKGIIIEKKSDSIKE
jgi:hypothetical protein